MENCINCNCVELYEAPERSSKHLLYKVMDFLTSVKIEGAEYLSKTK